MNHNNWKKVARKLSFSEEAPPDEIQCSSQSTSNNESNEENSQTASGHAQQTKSSEIDCQSSIQNKQPSRTSYTQLRLLKLGNVCQSSRKSRQPVIVLDQMTMKYNIRVIDYSCWQWQPNIPLDKLTDDDLKNVDCSLLQSASLPVKPIKFDKDEELIRELSPDTAAERFQKVNFIFMPLFRVKQNKLFTFVFFSSNFQQLEVIKKLSDETSQPKINSSTCRGAKKIKNKPCPEIEELDKRIQDIKPSKGKIGVRKLYNHEENKIVQNENIGSPKMRTKKDCIQNGQRLGKVMPMRLAKNRNISYTE